MRFRLPNNEKGSQDTDGFRRHAETDEVELGKNLLEWTRYGWWGLTDYPCIQFWT